MTNDPKAGATPADSPTRYAGRPLNSDERLLLDVVEALRGADNLRERLLGALHSGTPAVADLAYAVKARVKEDYKVVDKIRDRRRGGPDQPAKPGYGVSDVTDIVGLRIVTLYRLDALEIIRALLETIEADRSASAPFVAGSVSEVKIYSTNPTGDVQKLPARLEELFHSHGLASATSIAEKPSNYSSIHILLRGRGKYRDGYREVPVEIQVRTALEDVWGQIEHSLKYKRRAMRSTGASSNVDARLATTLSHLGALKTMIDGIAQYGDQIKLQIDELEPDLRYSSSRSAEEPNARLAAQRDIAAEVVSEVAAAFAEAKPGLTDQSLTVSARLRSLRSALSQLEAVADQEPTLTLRPKSRKELVYVVTMHRALIHFQLGNLLEHGEGQLNRALELYGEVEVEFPARLVVAYRRARALDSLGRRDEAIDRLRHVLDRLGARGEPTPKDHWIRSAVPRNLGVLLWEAANARTQGADGAAGGPAMDLLREAIEVTWTAQRAEVTEDPLAPSGSSEKARATNNLLYYLIEYVEAGGDSRDGMDGAAIRSALDELGIGDLGSIRSLSVADTVRRAYGHLGDRVLEQAAAARVVALSASTTGPRSVVIREAVRAAERILGNARVGPTEIPVAAPEEPEAPNAPARRPRRRKPKIDASSSGAPEGDGENN